MMFSILVPLYNKKDCLQNYFNTILEQTYDNYEIIVVDDKSTDGSFEYVQSMNNKKIHLYQNKKNRGLGFTRNELLKFANGDYFLFVDPDDYIELDLLDTLNKVLTKEELDVVRFQNIIEQEYKIGYFSTEQDSKLFCCRPTNIISGEQALLMWFMGDNNINTLPWTYCIKKELFNNIRYPETRVLEDFSVTPCLVAMANKVKAIDYVGYHYIKHIDSLSNPKLEDKKKYAKYKIAIFKKIVALCKKNIYNLQISVKSKRIFCNDVDNRYRIRLERVKKILEEKD